MTPNEDPRTKYPTPPQPQQKQASQPGDTHQMFPEPDHGESSYVGSDRLKGMRSLITGGDSGIGRAVAIAYAREGSHIAISYHPDDEEDAQETKRLVETEGVSCVLLPGDIIEESVCVQVITDTLHSLGGLDVLILNAGTQREREDNAEISRAAILKVFETNLVAPLIMMREAAPHLMPGASVIVTASIQSTHPSPDLLDYAMTKAALVAFTRALSQEQADRGVRVNAVAPGPIWTPLIPATGWDEKVVHFGEDTPLGRAGQPAELAGAYVYLASEDASYVSGALLPVTGGKLL